MRILKFESKSEPELSKHINKLNFPKKESKEHESKATEKKEKMARKMVKVMGHEVREGSKKHTRLMQDKKHYDDLSRSEH